ncbi:MAG TPA: ArsA-related P-loop ATPase [Actinomycetes bacterium]|nr:ArsA-related P-loop ATPase [Actinomycetes bacterium]
MARPKDAPSKDWPDVRLHVVTGKGGTGKTTAAGALALALASGGGRVLIVEVEGRQGLAQLFDTPPLGYAEERLAPAPEGGEVFGLAVDPEDALLEYLELFYRMRSAGRLLDRFGVVDFATTIAPGLRDVLLTGKVYEAVGKRRAGRREYDAVVLDAPPTGRIARFLNVNSEVAGLAKVGPIRSQADSIMGLLRSRRTAIHVVTLLEEMPVQETVDAVAELAEIGLPVGGIVLNMLRSAPLRPTDLAAAAKDALPRAEVLAGLGAAGVEATPETVAVLLEEAREAAERAALERRERRRVSALGRPMYALPLLADGMDLGGLQDLAAELAAQGAA